MRAAITFAYDKFEDLTSALWRRIKPGGKMIGNPSISEIVSGYMTALRRRKVCLYYLVNTASQTESSPGKKWRGSDKLAPTDIGTSLWKPLGLTG